jgi:hypothetical protein
MDRLERRKAPWARYCSVTVAALAVACTTPPESPARFDSGTLGVPGDAAADSVVACPAPRLSIDDCFRGITFANCGGSAEPALGCNESGCLWFEGGCYPNEYSPGRCRSMRSCINEWIGWGNRPWTRERAMELSVAFGEAREDEGGIIGCGCLNEACTTLPAWCDDPPRQAHRPGDAWTMPGLVVVSYLLVGGGELGTSLWLHLEIDLYAAPMKARLCAVEDSDGSVFGEPICADGGTVVVEGTGEGSRPTHGILAARFSGEWGMTLSASFQID